jgi:hypothetical protein
VRGCIGVDRYGSDRLCGLGFCGNAYRVASGTRSLGEPSVARPNISLGWSSCGSLSASRAVGSRGGSPGPPSKVALTMS